MRAMPPSIANRNTVWYMLMSFANTGPDEQTKSWEKREKANPELNKNESLVECLTPCPYSTHTVCEYIYDLLKWFYSNYNLCQSNSSPECSGDMAATQYPS